MSAQVHWWEPVLLHNDPRGLKSHECILLNERLCDISLVRLREQICRVYQTVNDVSVCYYCTFHGRKYPLRFSNNKLLNRSISISFTTKLAGWVSLTAALLLWLNNNPCIHAAHSVFQIFRISIFAAAFHATELLSWAKSGKYRNDWPYELSYLLLCIH